MKKNTKKRFYEDIGWFGMIASLAGYLLISFSILTPHGLSYQLLVGLGSLGLVVSSYYKHDYQPLMLNFVWLIIAVGVIGVVLLHH